MSDNKLKTVKKVISEKTGLDPQEITPDSFIGDDLNIGELELHDILIELEEMFDAELIDYKDDIETIQDILDALAEEIE